MSGIGTTQASSWVSDITNPKIYIKPASGNTQETKGVSPWEEDELL